MIEKTENSQAHNRMKNIHWVAKVLIVGLSVDKMAEFS